MAAKNAASARRPFIHDVFTLPGIAGLAPLGELIRD